MNSEEKRVMARIYAATRYRPGKLLGADIHRLIAEAEGDVGEVMWMHIYEQRLYAETMIGRPKMNAFMSMLRAKA
jgi:hypothetical protein